MNARKYADAVKAYQDALKLYPNDPTATKGLKDAQDGLKPPPPNPQAEYQKQMALGAAADKEKRWADSLTAYREALKQKPGDTAAAAALKNADYNQHMAEGKKLHAARKYADAVKEFQEALKIMPNDPDARAALKKAQDMTP